jgi:muconolactone D-isomerase
VRGEQTALSSLQIQHPWRVVGQYSNLSIFDVETNDELHDLLSGLPLYPYMQIEVTPLSAHPSAMKG